MRAWPSLLLALVVLVAAVYAFSPRPHPEFPPTQLEPTELLVNGLARQGSRYVAVGEQGRILLADDANGPWREARIEPQRGSTFTQVVFVDDNAALAIGHDSWIVRSEDRGETWREVAYDPSRSEALLGIAGPFGDKLFAFGTFGQFLTSTNMGKSWQRETLVEEGAEAASAAASENVEDMFAAAAGGGIGERHLNGMIQTAEGALLLVGERGLMALSTNNGQTWKALPEVYQGSFYGALRLPSNDLLAYGMRGNAFLSRDHGKTWSKSAVPQLVSLQAGAVTAKGNIVLVGSGDAVMFSNDGGRTFRLVAQEDRHGLAAVLPVGKSEWLTAGEGGIELRRPFAASGAAQAQSQPPPGEPS